MKKNSLKPMMSIAMSAVALALIAGGLYSKGFFDSPLDFTSRPNLGKDMISESDFVRLVELHNECFDPDKRKHLKDYLLTVKYPHANQQISDLVGRRVEDYVRQGHESKLEYMRETENVTWVSKNKEMLGLYNCRTDEDVTRGSVMIFNVCVAKKARGQGIGTALMNHAIANCKKPGQDLTLTVYTDNQPAIHLYKKLKFQIVSPDREPEDGFFMYRKHLMKYVP